MHGFSMQLLAYATSADACFSIQLLVYTTSAHAYNTNPLTRTLVIALQVVINHCLDLIYENVQ